MNIDQARLLANINDRAQRITEDYRIIWDRREGHFVVAHKADRNRRYIVTVGSCACASFEHHGTCKHHIGLPALLVVEIARYTLLGFTADRSRMEALLAEIESAVMWADENYLRQVEDEYGDRRPW